MRAEMLNIGKVLEARRQSVGDFSDEETLKHAKNMVNNCAQRIKVIASLTFIEAKMLSLKSWQPSTITLPRLNGWFWQITTVAWGKKPQP